MKFLLFFFGFMFLFLQNFAFTMDESQQVNIRSSIAIARLVGDVNPSKNEDFTLVAANDPILRPNKSGIYVQKQTLDALRKVAKDFRKHFPNIQLFLLSGMRNFSYQKGIWEYKWDTFAKEGLSSQEIRKKILEYSSMPGISRHHWGTDVDIVYINSKDFKTPLGKKIYSWMRTTLPKYGFAQCFNPGRKGGYNTEEWHWSYIPVSRAYIQSYHDWLDKDPKRLTSIIRSVKGLSKADISDEDLTAIIREYVFNVASACS